MFNLFLGNKLLKQQQLEFLLASFQSLFLCFRDFVPREGVFINLFYVYKDSKSTKHVYMLIVPLLRIFSKIKLPTIYIIFCFFFTVF